VPLLLAALLVPTQAALAQQIEELEGALIESTEVSGLALDQLSPGLRQDINALTGDRLVRERVDTLAGRIETERPDVVAAVRAIARPEGKVRVVFLVARISEDRDLAVNINARYTVESVEITGVPDSAISQELRADLQTLVGEQLDPEAAKRLENRIEAEVPGYEVRRRISRGTQAGRIRVVFEMHKIEAPAWIPFIRSKSKIVYHSRQGWSGALDIPMGGASNHRVTLGLVFGDNDDLIEEYSGYGLRFESRRIATDRLGLSVEVLRHHQSWREATAAAVAADPQIPELYRSRLTLEPFLTFALNPHVRLAAGISVSQLESLSRSPDSETANPVVASVAYDQQIRRSRVEASYEFRSATTALDSDLLYKRHRGRARYAYQYRNNLVLATFLIGRITGRAPLFERFTLGDTSTLRGWNKFDIAPAGGDRVFHQSLEYRFRHLAFFVDTGSVWDRGAETRLLVAAGAGFHGDNAFLTLGFPLNADRAGGLFMMGVRF
jgi:hypothetical protein